jgi:adenine-specific DNA methylase
MQNLDFLNEIFEELGIDVTSISKEEAIEELKSALEVDEVMLEKFSEDIENLKLFYPNLFHQLSDSIANPFRDNDEEGEE